MESPEIGQIARPRPGARHAVALALLLALLPTAPAIAGPDRPAKVGAWKDVARHQWARRAVDFVAAKHLWMRDYGGTHFKPDRLETRKYLAHAMVMAFARHEPVSRRIHFGDMAKSDPFYPFANVAVKLHWMKGIHGDFKPDGPVTTIDVHQALVRALGLGKVAVGFNRIHTSGGYHFRHPPHAGVLEIGMLLGLRYNHHEEGLDVGPATRLDRSEVAWSLSRAYVAKTSESWRIDTVRAYGDVVLPPLSHAMRRVVEFGLRYVGYPYIYAGEWGRRTPSSYCCGAQPRGGFDCSGLAWWLMKAPGGGYDDTRFRRYEGWSLDQRVSSDMAAHGKAIRFAHLRPGDLMFYDGSGSGIDHVDTFVGDGYALDSSDGIGGVTLLRVDSGWYRQHFVHGRRIVR